MSAAHDFDFNHGEWKVTNRRLKVRGVGSDDWEVFPSFETAQLLMGGRSRSTRVISRPRASRA